MALPVVRQFIDEVRPKAIGADVIRSVTPGQMVIKIVNDHLVEMLGGTVADLDLNAIPPVVILMVGLQGSGKTTLGAKIGYRLSQGPQGMAAEMFGGSFATKRKVMMASLDTRRPAAQQQLADPGPADRRADPADRAARDAARHHAARAGDGAARGLRRR